MGWSPSRESKPALPLTRRLHRHNASGASTLKKKCATRCAAQKIDKRTALPLSIPKKREAVARSAVQFLDVHDVKQQRFQSSAHARALAPRPCTDRQLVRRARRRECGRAPSIHLGCVAFG